MSNEKVSLALTQAAGTACSGLANDVEKIVNEVSDILDTLMDLHYRLDNKPHPVLSVLLSAQKDLTRSRVDLLRASEILSH